MERRYASLSDLRAYSARVAAAVGAMMCVLMRVRDPNALARACDLGVAMQLTNIARDVGEDAREGRLYLPTDWMHEAGITPEAFLRDPEPTPQVRAMVRRLLREADDRYARCECGGLPNCRSPAGPAFSPRATSMAASTAWCGPGVTTRSRGAPAPRAARNWAG